MAIRITEDQWKKLVDRNYYNEQLRQLGVKDKKYASDYLTKHRTAQELDDYYNNLNDIYGIASNIRDYYKNTGNADYQAMADYVTELDKVLGGRETVTQMYGNFADQAAYDAYIKKVTEDAERNEYLRNVDIDALSARLAWLGGKTNQFGTNNTDFLSNPNTMQSLMSDIKNGYTLPTTQAERDQEIAQLQKDIEEARYIQRIAAYESAVNNPDFNKEELLKSRAPSDYWAANPYHYLTDDQMAILNYWDSKEDPNFRDRYDSMSKNLAGLFGPTEGIIPSAPLSAADEYYDYLAPQLRQSVVDEFKTFGQENKHLGTGLSFLTNAGAMVTQPITFLTGDFNSFAAMTTGLREGATADMDAWNAFFYNLAVSGAESAAAAAIPMGLGTIPLAASAAAATQNDILLRGGTEGQAVIGGLLAGGAEAFFEAFSIGALADMVKSGSIKTFFKNFMGNLIKEVRTNASEELATELANIISDELIMGELSNYNTMVAEYVASGMSEEDAHKKAKQMIVHQIGEAAASGALMGGGFAVLGGAVNTGANFVTGSATTKNAKLYDKLNQAGATLSLDVDNEKTADARKLYAKIEGYNEAQQNGKKAGPLKKAQNRVNVGRFANMLAYDADVNEALKKLNTGAKQNVSQTVQTAEKVSKEANISKDNAEVTKSAMPQIVKAEGQELSQIYIEKDGNMVSLDKVAIEDADLAAAYSYAVTTGSVENANSFLKSYALSTTNASPTAFWSAWMGIAANGQTLKTTEENQAKVFAEYGDIISDDAKLAAWLSGVTMKQTASERRIKAAEQARAEWEKGGKKVTKAKIDATELQNVELDAKQKEFVAFGRLFAEAFGINVKFVASKKGNRGDNGKYNRTTNTITLDVFSGIDNKANYNAVQSALSNTLSHEVVHNMRIVTPEVYDILSEYVFETLKAQGMDIDSRIQYYIDEAKREENKTMSREDAIEEIVAHACDGMLQTSETVREFMEGFYAKDKRAANRFSQAVKDVLKRLKQVFESLLGVKAYSAEAHVLYKAGADSIAEIQKIFDQGIANLREGNLARNYEVQGKSEAETASGEMYSLRGVNKDGIEVYETSEEIKKLPIKERQKAFLDIMKNEYRGRTAKFIRNGHAYYASFDYRDINKNIYGDKLSDKKGWKAKINVGAEGEIFELVENSKYDGSKPESGKNIAAHSGVGYWDYFVKTVQIDNTVFDLIANVRKKTDGAFVYSIQLKENKKIKASPSLGSPNGVLNRMLNASANNVAQKTGVVNTNSQNSSDEMKQSRYDQAAQTEINESMTMEQAKQMIQRAFVMGGIKEWYDGEYKNGDEWAKAQGADEVALYIDNEYQLQELYVNKIPGVLDEKFFIADVVEAYLNGTLTGKVKKKAEKLDLGKSVKVADSRFYAPQAIEKAKALYEIANQRLNDENRAVVINARAKILLYAHNKGAAETLGISQSDLNKKLRSWSNYSDRARQTSIKINAGIEESNRWTGIENVAYINKSRVSAEEVARMVKAIEGKSDAFQNKYIARTMLALDTHIDWSWLTFKFDSSQGVNDAMIGGSGRANGYYRDSERLIHAITNSPNTIAHEMGHALDHQWARDLGLGNTSLTEAYRNTDRVSGDVKIWFDQFKAFSDSLAESASLYSAYTMDVQEAFARFVAKFVEWTEVVSTGRSSGYETSYYNDKFTTAQFVEFARILQGKAALDANGLTKNKVVEAGDVMRSDRMSQEELARLREEYNAAYRVQVEAKKELDEIGEFPRYDEMLDIISDKKASNEDRDRILDEYKKWQEESGYKAAYDKLSERERNAKDVRRQIEIMEDNLSKALREKQYTEDEIKAFVQKAVRKYRTTSSLNRAAYLVTTGSMLDFSEGQGYRVKDHREISEILDLPDYAQYSDGMIVFMNMGNIRLQTYGIDISAMPNDKQISTLRSIIPYVMREYDEFTVDFSKPNGNSDGSVTYPKGVATSRIISDIKSYFETGKVPEYEDRLSQFMYSKRQKDTDYLTAVENGDMETAQRMVDEAAIAAGAMKLKDGVTKHYYHGTNAKFTSFEAEKARDGTYGFGFYFSPMKSKASQYGELKDVYLMTERIATRLSNNITAKQVNEFLRKYNIDLNDTILKHAESIEDWMAFKGDDMSIMLDLQRFVTKYYDVEIKQLLTDFINIFGYDGIRQTNETVLWDNRLIKSADPVTYDDNGKVIPLSKRFNTEEEDIRYSKRKQTKNGSNEPFFVL